MSIDQKEPNSNNNDDFIPSSTASPGKSIYIEGLNPTHVVDNTEDIHKLISSHEDYFKPKATLESWIEYMKSSPSGLNVHLENFLLNSPEYFKTGEEAFAVAPKDLENVSNLMTKLATGTDNPDATAKKIVLTLGEEFVAEFREFMGDKGFNPKEFSTDPVSHEFSMAEWIEAMEKTKDGLNPLLKDFILKNPDLYNPDLNEGEGVTPRALGQASKILSQPVRNAVVAQALEDTLGKEVLQRLSQHVQDNVTKLQLADGPEAKTTVSRKENDSTPEL